MDKKIVGLGWPLFECGQLINVVNVVNVKVWSCGQCAGGIKK